MRKELGQRIVEENKYISLLKKNPQYRLQGYSMELKKVVVGIIEGKPEEYKQYKDHLSFKYFDTWKEAYLHLV